jgi:hypothetical protein
MFGAGWQQVVEGAVVEQRHKTAGQHHHVDVGLPGDPGQLAGVLHAPRRWHRAVSKWSSAEAQMRDLNRTVPESACLNRVDLPIGHK